MKLYWRRKQVRLDIHGFWLCLVLASASAIRVILIALGWPLTNSDEGTMGLMALHIAFRGEHPIFFYGQNYMGSLEAYAGAVLFHLFGPSLFTLRFGLVLLFVLFLFILYLLVRLLYSKEYALLSITLLCFGSSEMLTQQLKVVGGAIETLLFGCLTLLLTTCLILPSQRETTAKTSKVRYLLYGLLGLATGLGIWSHLLVLPFAGVSFLLLFLFCRAEWKTWSILFLLLGLFIGLLPLLIYNLENPLQNSIKTLLLLHSTGGIVTTQIPQSYSFWDNLLGTILISVPMATGTPLICTISAASGVWREQLSPCMIVQGFWGAGFLLLFLLACLLTVKSFISTYRSAPIPHSYDDRKSLVLDTTRFMVLASAGTTLLAFVFSPAPALVPVTSARYLVGLLVAFPVILAPLWKPLQKSISVSRLRNMLKRGRVEFLAIGLLLVCATWGVFQQVPSVQAVNTQRQKLITDLEAIHVTRMYSDYWTCDNIIFQSDEHIICGVLDDNLQPWQNRYMPYLTMVQRDPHAAYVFPASSPQAKLFAQTFGNGKMKRSYSTLAFDGYIVFQWER